LYYVKFQLSGKGLFKKNYTEKGNYVVHRDMCLLSGKRVGNTQPVGHELKPRI